MRVRVQVVIESENGESECIQEVACLERTALGPEQLGLTLAEAKGLLESVQQRMVTEQVKEYSARCRSCPHCGRERRRKGKHEIVYRTLFGKLELESLRLYECPCQTGAGRRSVSPLAELLPERTAPELVYLETKFAALMSYGLTVELLSEVLPLSRPLSVSSLHRQVQQVGERMESELGEEQMFFIEGCPREWAELARPEMPLVVGLDGGYVHSCEQKARKESCFEVIVGKSMTAEGESKCFGFVNSYDEKPKRRLFEVLKSQGMQMNQQVTFLSDGGDTVRELQLYLNPEAEHVLDWFHITMRLTVMQQMARGLGLEDCEARMSALKELDSIKWYLWHGNVFQALEHINFLEMDLDGEIITGESGRKLRQAVREFYTYIENNQQWIPNYGDRYRHGERISTGFVESTVNQVIAKRMVKKQQMRWTKRGAHLLLLPGA